VVFIDGNRRQLRDNTIRSQPLDKQQQMTGLFEMLKKEVERNLLTQSRDRCVSGKGGRNSHLIDATSFLRFTQNFNFSAK
jgi:hypothetical protein